MSLASTYSKTCTAEVLMSPSGTVSGIPALEQGLAPSGWSDPFQIPHLTCSHVTSQPLLVALLSC